MTNGHRIKNNGRFSSMLTCGQRLQRLQRRGLSAGCRGRGCGERCEWAVSLLAGSPVAFVSHVLLSIVSFGDVGRYTERVHFRFCPTHYQNNRIILLLIALREEDCLSIAAIQVTQPTIFNSRPSQGTKVTKVTKVGIPRSGGGGGKARNFGK